MLVIGVIAVCQVVLRLAVVLMIVRLITLAIDTYSKAVTMPPIEQSIMAVVMARSIHFMAALRIVVTCGP